MSNLKHYFEVFEGQAVYCIKEQYTKEVDQKKHTNFMEVLEKLDKIVGVFHRVGRENCEYYFRSYSPGSVSADPFFYYFNKEIDLANFLGRKPENLKIGWDKYDENGHCVTHRYLPDEQPRVIGFVERVDLLNV